MTPSTLLHPLKLDVVGFQEDEHDYHFRVELPEPKCCQSCGTLYNLVKFGKDDQAYRDAPIHDKRSTIWVVRGRYKCNSCNPTFRPDLKDMDDRRMMTKRLVRHIEIVGIIDKGEDSENMGSHPSMPSVWKLPMDTTIQPAPTAVKDVSTDSYWYMPQAKAPGIFETRPGEDTLRFTNQRQPATLAQAL